MTLDHVETNRKSPISGRRWRECTNAVLFRCSILLLSNIPAHIRGVHKQSTHLCMRLDCKVHHLYVLHPPVHLNSTSCLAPHKVGVEYWACKNVTVTGSNFENTFFRENTWLRTMYCLQIIWWENRGVQWRLRGATILHREGMVQAGHD